MANRWIDPDEIRKAIELLKPNNEIYECRIIDQNGKIRSGYFRGPDKLIEELSRQNLEGCNVYFTLHELHEGVEARMQWEHFISQINKNADRPATSREDVLRYKYLPVDVDPIRPKGISSNSEELEAAKRVRETVIDYMTENGYSSRIEAFSGNGYHSIFRLPEELRKLPAREVCDIIKEKLQELKELCSTSAAKVDSGNFEPSRVFKLYGTLAQKGRNMSTRPYRMARIEKVVDW